MRKRLPSHDGSGLKRLPSGESTRSKCLPSHDGSGLKQDHGRNHMAG